MTQRIVNYTYGTGNPVLPDGSIDVRDGVDNLQSFDIFMNAEEDEYNQRDGVISPTVRGAIKALGPVVTAWTFTTGGTLNHPNEAALNPADGNYYGWTGTFPKVVAPGADPTPPGSGYVPRTDVVLRGELESGGASIDYIAKSFHICTITPEQYGADGTLTGDTAALLACFNAARIAPTELALGRMYKVNQALACYFVQTHNLGFTITPRHSNCGIEWYGPAGAYVVDIHGYNPVVGPIKLVEASGASDASTALRVCGEGAATHGVIFRGPWHKNLLGVAALKAKFSGSNIQTTSGVVTDFVGAGVQLVACVNTTVANSSAVGTYSPWIAGTIPTLAETPDSLKPPSLTESITFGAEGVDFISCKGIKQKVGAILGGLEINMTSCILDFCVDKYALMAGQMIKVNKSWFACDTNTSPAQEMLGTFGPGAAYVEFEGNTLDTKQASTPNQIATFSYPYSDFSKNILSGITATVDGTYDSTCSDNIPTIGTPDVVMTNMSIYGSIMPKRAKEKRAQGLILGKDAPDGDAKLQIRGDSGERIINAVTAGGVIMSTCPGGIAVTPTTPASDAILYLAKINYSGRSLNAMGTVNASGSDYAEYMRKADSCGVIAKGQVVGITVSAEITDKFDDAVAFAIKSTDPSMVGGDTWGKDVAYPELSVSEPRKQPAPICKYGQSEDAFNEEMAAVDAAYEAELAAYNLKVSDYQQALAEYTATIEAIRERYDRIAFSGQVPCDAVGGNPGDYVVPVRGECGGISCKLTASPSFDEYRIAVGQVWKVMDDGRAWVSVKIA